MALLIQNGASLLVGLFFFAALAGAKGADPVSPYKLKSAFIYNFLKFVDWPDSAFQTPKSPFVLGVLGKDPFGTILDESLRGKSVNGRPVTVKRVSDEEIMNCHLLFISSSERKRLRQILEKIKKAPVLSVGEANGFAEDGGIINFVQEGNKIRFQINVDAANRSGLKLNSAMLNLAKIVHDR